MSVRKEKSVQPGAEGRGWGYQGVGARRPSRRRQMRNADLGRRRLVPMSEREIATLLRHVEGDPQEELPEQSSEEILDAGFDEDSGLWDHVDPLSAHLRHRSSMQAILADDIETAW